MFDDSSSRVLTLILVAETAVTNTHLFTCRVNVINRLSADEAMLLADMITIGQAMAAVVAIEPETGAGDFGTILEFLTERE